MSCQIVIDWSNTLIRIGVATQSKLTHLYLIDALNPSLQDWIIEGRVAQVVKNMKSVFVDFGHEKKGLLPMSQIPDKYANKIQQGKKLPIQIKREQTGEKGHKLTGYLNIKGDCLISMPFESGIMFSKKIKDEAIKARIRASIQKYQSSEGAFMVRTKAQEVPEEVLEKEIQMLVEQTQTVLSTSEAVAPSTVLLKSVPLYVEVIKERLGLEETVECVVNHPEIQQELEHIFKDIPNNQFQCRSLPKEENLFGLFGFEKAFENTFKHKIWLKNGGNIVVDYTEAMTVIDVNSAKAIQGKEQAQAVVALNRLAVEEAIGQIIRRNLSGIIIIDLVDFVNRKDREEIVSYAKALLQSYHDKRTKVYPLTELDLLQLVRTKEHLPYRETLQEGCLCCHTSFKKMSKQYHAFELEKKIKHIKSHTNLEQIFIKVNKIFYTYLTEQKLITLFESAYSIKIQLDENDKMQELYEVKYY